MERIPAQEVPGKNNGKSLDYTGFTVTGLEAAKAQWLFPLRKSHPDGSEDRRHQL